MLCVRASHNPKREVLIHETKNTEEQAACLIGDGQGKETTATEGGCIEGCIVAFAPAAAQTERRSQTGGASADSEDVETPDSVSLPGRLGRADIRSPVRAASDSKTAFEGVDLFECGKRADAD